MKQLFFLAIILCFSVSSFSQTDTTKTPLAIREFTEAKSEEQGRPLIFSGYVEAYYSYDFGKPENHTMPGFIYNFNRHNEVNINLGFIKAKFTKEKVRGNFALMAGTYANANMINEPGVLKNLYEANAGFKLSRNKNLWIDGGVFSSHIGFESAIGKDCWNLTRSMLADNSPYFESGAKISYTSDNDKWFISAMYLNGWQRIQREDGNNTPAFGHQLTYKPTKKVLLNSSSFIGSDTPDSIRQMRYFHNFYAQAEVNDKIGFMLGFDIGAQQKSKGSSSYYIWYSPVLIVKYLLTDKIYLAARGEYYADKNQVIIYTGTPNGFKTFGYSLNLDYVVSENLMWRIEGKRLNSEDKIFILNNTPNNNYYSLTTSLAISF